MINKRVKLLFIPKWQVLDCVLNPIPRMVSVIQHEELPKEYEILGVSYDFCRDGFIFKLSHPSWPEVEEGEIPEIINKIATITKLYSVHPYNPQPSAKDSTVRMKKLKADMDDDVYEAFGIQRVWGRRFKLAFPNW